MSAVHQGWYVLCSGVAKFNSSYYHSYAEEMCNWGFITFSKKLSRTRPGQAFQKKTNNKVKVLQDGRGILRMITVLYAEKSGEANNPAIPPTSYSPGPDWN